MNMRKFFAGVAAAATLLGGLALGAATANAAGTATITINGNVAGRTFTAYPLGTYKNVVTTTDGNCAATVDFEQNAVWAEKSIAEAAAEAAKVDDTNGTVPAQYTGNELAWITTLDQTTDGAKLRKFAETLADSKTKPTAAATVEAADAANAELTNLDEGYYLVIDSEGAPILVGTQVTVGQKLVNCIGATTNLGVANAKPTTVPTPDKTVTDVTVSDGTNSAKIGDTLSYEVSGVVPVTTGYDPYTYVVKDVASKGLEIQQNTLKVTLDGKNLTADTEAKVNDYLVSFTTDQTTGETTTLVTLHNVAGYDGKNVVVTYKAKITKDLENNVVNNKASVSHNSSDFGSGKTVEVHVYDFGFTKTDANGDALAGAEFVISKDSVYYVQDATTLAWTTTTDKSKATKFVSGADGKITIKGLAAGTYTVEETKVPDQYLQNTVAKFTVKLGGATDPTFAGTDTWGLAPKESSTDYKVKNVKSITQLPLTGAAGTALFTVLGLLLAGAAATVYTKSRSTRRALRA